MRAREQGWRGSIRQLQSPTIQGNVIRDLAVGRWYAQCAVSVLPQPRIGGQHGHDDTSYNPHRCADSFRWRLVRPGTLVLKTLMRLRRSRSKLGLLNLSDKGPCAERVVLRASNK